MKISFYDSRLYRSHILQVARFYKNYTESLQNKSILLTGASGLIGSFLCDSLLFSDINFRLIILCRDSKKIQNRFHIFLKDKRLKIKQVNICESFSINEKLDYIIHLASPAQPHQFASAPLQVINLNINATQNLINLALEKNAKFIFASSGEVYGQNLNHKIKETDMGYINPLDLRSCYNESKKMAETLLNAYAFESGLKFISLRISRCFGASMKAEDNRAISSFLKNAAENKNILLKSKGNQKYSYIYVADCVKAFLHSLENLDSNNAYNVANNEVLSLKKVALLISRLNTDSKLEQIIMNENELQGYSKAQNALLDTTKIESSGFKCNFTLKQGLEISLEILKEIL